MGYLARIPHSYVLGWPVCPWRYGMSPDDAPTQEHSLASSVTLLLDSSHHLRHSISLFQLQQHSQLIQYILLVYDRQAQRCWFRVQECRQTVTSSKLSHRRCTAGFNEMMPGGPVTKQYQYLYLTSETAVSLYIFSEVDQVLPLGPISSIHSCITGRIGCAW